MNNTDYPEIVQQNIEENQSVIKYMGGTQIPLAI
jgi:hypothetical protein